MFNANKSWFGCSCLKSDRIFNRGGKVMSCGLLFIFLIINYARRQRELWSFRWTKIWSIRGMRLVVSKQFHRQLTGNIWHYQHKPHLWRPNFTFGLSTFCKKNNPSNFHNYYVSHKKIRLCNPVCLYFLCLDKLTSKGQAKSFLGFIQPPLNIHNDVFSHTYLCHCSGSVNHCRIWDATW